MGKADKFLKMGEKLENEGKFDDAYRAYIKGTEEDPQDKKSWIALADLSANRSPRNLERALMGYAEAVKIDGKDVDTLKKLGQVCCDLNQWSKAAKVYEKAFEIKPPKDPESWVKLSVIYKNAQQWDKVIESCDHAIKLNSKSVKPFVGLGHAYMELGDWSKAIVNLEQALLLDEQCYEAMYLLGMAKNYAGDFHRGEDILIQAIKMKPHVASAWEKLGMLYINAERKAEALYCYQEADKFGDITGKTMASELVKEGVQPQKPKQM